MGHVACSRKAVLIVFSEAKHHPTFMYLFGFLVFFGGSFCSICVYIYIHLYFISISLYAYHIYIHSSPWFGMVRHCQWLERSEEEKIDFANARKDVGARFFKEGRYSMAMERYKKIVDLFNYVDSYKAHLGAPWGRPFCLSICKDPKRSI